MKKSFVATTLAGLLVGVGTGQVNASGYTFTDLGTLGGRYSFAFGINNSGQVVGGAYTTLDTSHATIWNGTTPTDLGTLGPGQHSVAFAINDAGQVVGWSDYDVTAFNYHATIWDGTTPTDLGTLGGVLAWPGALTILVKWWDGPILQATLPSTLLSGMALHRPTSVP